MQCATTSASLSHAHSTLYTRSMHIQSMRIIVVHFRRESKLCTVIATAVTGSVVQDAALDQASVQSMHAST
eukprot:8664-Heterococcus_DN1.PRE.1